MQGFPSLSKHTSALIRSNIIIIALACASLLPFIPGFLVWTAPSLTTAIGQTTKLNAVRIGTGNYSFYPDSGHAVKIGLSALQLNSLSDSSCEQSGCSPIMVLENGTPLKAHQAHADLRSMPSGGFSHWGEDLYLSPSPGVDPYMTNYTLLYPAIAAESLFTALPLKRMVWWCAFAAAIIAALLGSAVPWSNSRSMRGILVVCLALALFVQVRFMKTPSVYGTSSWETFVFAPDSQTWMEPYSAETTRPFLYPTFAHLITKISGNPVDQTALYSLPLNVPIVDRLGDPMLTVVKAQKVFHLLAIVIAAWILSAFIPAPIVMVGMGWLYSNIAFPNEYDHVMAETVAQAWMFLLVAAIASTIFRYVPSKLFIVAAVAAALFHTRSAGIFSFASFGCLALWVLAKDPRKNWRVVGLGFATLGILAALPSLHRFFATKHLAPAPMYADAQTAYAVQFAQDEDIELFGDPIVKEWVKRVLVKRLEAHQAVRAAMPVVSDTQLLGTNLYTVARGVAGDMGLSETERLKIFSEFSAAILPKYRMKYLGLFLENFSNTAQITRLRGSSARSNAILLSALAIVSIAIWSREGLFCLLLLVGHFSHLVIISLFDVPQQRYVFATEFLVVIGSFFLMVGLARRIRDCTSWIVVRCNISGGLKQSEA
jgi:hypothetical protein